MSRQFVFLLCLIAPLWLCGCIRSSLEIDSSPQGAQVTVNNRPIGRTPVQMPLIWYWYYDVKVEKPGFQTVQSVDKISAPVWAVFPLDLLAEAAPFYIKDRRARNYVLQPVVEE